MKAQKVEPKPRPPVSDRRLAVRMSREVEVNGKTFVVRKDLPAPPPSTSRRYPYHLLEVGESTDIPLATPGDEKKARSAAASTAKRAGKKFSTSLVLPNVLRVWRVK